MTLGFGETEFAPAHGLDGGEIVQKLGAQTETAEVLGVLHSEAISEDDIALGRYDGARVQSWRVNWRALEQ
ncbi:MAG TPA: beta tubulin, partial [Pelagibacterium sp.]|nr:beta tubulin [Pelagibacterium sp.]